MCKNNSIPLYIDLDGTFIKSDMLFESLIFALKKNPLIIFFCLFWIFYGKSYLKYKLAEYVDIDVETLPINPELYEFLLNEKKTGRKIYLATASTEKIAKLIISKFNVFDGFLSSTRSVNLKGRNKLIKIKEQDDVFAYAGNDKIDFEIFAAAKQKILVNPTSSVLKEANKLNIDIFFDISKFSFSTWIKQLRVHQWLKNLLIFVPLVVSGKYFEISSILITITSFFAFSLLASATYILNDLLDLSSDRVHPRKKFRPLAAGKISLKSGLTATLALFSVSMLFSYHSGLDFLLILLSYLFFTLFYSFKIKKYVGIDVVCLALLYTKTPSAAAPATILIV